jgi:hypothetical protein
MKGYGDVAEQVSTLKGVIAVKKQKREALSDDLKGLSSIMKGYGEMISQLSFLREAVPLIKEKNNLMAQIMKVKEAAEALKQIQMEDEALTKECSILEGEKRELEACNPKAQEEVEHLKQLKVEYDSLMVVKTPARKLLVVKTPSRVEETPMEKLLKMEAGIESTQQLLKDLTVELQKTGEIKGETIPIPEVIEEEEEGQAAPSLESLQESLRRVKGPNSIEGLTPEEQTLLASIDSENFRSIAATLYSYVPMGYKSIRYGFIKHLSPGNNDEVRLDFIEQLRGCPSISIERIVIEAGEILNMDVYKQLIALDVCKSNGNKLNKHASRLSKVATHCGIGGFTKTKSEEVPWLSICICSVMRQRGVILSADEISRIADS